MHEENSWSSWLREEDRGKEEKTARAEKKEEEKGEKRKREEEKEENETGTVEKRCEGCVSVEASDDCSWGDPLEKLDDLSECELVSCALVRVVPDVTDMLVFPSSVVTEFCDISSTRSPFPSPKKRALC